MINKKINLNTIKNESINTIINLLENKYDDQIEYIYVDKSILTKNRQDNLLFKEKIFITTDDNNLQMLDFELNEKDILNFTPKVDLLIIDHHNKLNNFTKNIIDKHTIISKILSDDTIYIEDALNQLKIIISKDETYIFKDNQNYKYNVPMEFKYT
ncbi:hypothetical protein [Methanosphaera cuniculi]|uniref:hypothetical protein n=1 Tax=Methanosphaera cuniculi TaxID=1077256 RepID=UPI0026EBBAC2|nr:hypothetical protein [Methanosphaera cuniculi]